VSDCGGAGVQEPEPEPEDEEEEAEAARKEDTQREAVIATGSSRRSCVGSKGFPLAPPMPPMTPRLVEVVGSATNWWRRRGAGG